MTKLWVFQTNKQEYLDDCRSFQVYGVADPGTLNLDAVTEGDFVLLRLKFQNKNKYGYLGPFVASSKKKDWVSEVAQHDGIWKQITSDPTHSPCWLNVFPWCIFLEPSENYISELRMLRINRSVPACQPIPKNIADEIISNLIQDEYLPDSKVGSYRTVRGVWVRSRAEYMIDNWFTEHGIVTYYERAIYLNSIRIIPDWYIPSLKIYVEFLGLKGDPTYDSIWKQKEKTFRDNGIKYVTLVDKDLADLNSSIPMKLPELKTMGIQ
ncbi:hypothetical protein BMS3Abin10_01560 [bacterium BMS3Abin10]|nr:hypothetical protein BMS3Abin10_01560 [bacterium BMS3Abin10]